MVRTGSPTNVVRCEVVEAIGVCTAVLEPSCLAGSARPLLRRGGRGVAGQKTANREAVKLVLVDFDNIINLFVILGTIAW